MVIYSSCCYTLNSAICGCCQKNNAAASSPHGMHTARHGDPAARRHAVHPCGQMPCHRFSRALDAVADAAATAISTAAAAAAEHCLAAVLECAGSFLIVEFINESRLTFQSKTSGCRAHACMQDPGRRDCQAFVPCQDPDCRRSFVQLRAHGVAGSAARVRLAMLQYDADCVISSPSLFYSSCISSSGAK